jgi:hypothetical protein
LVEQLFWFVVEKLYNMTYFALELEESVLKAIVISYILKALLTL